MEIRGIGYLGLNETELAPWREFGEDLLGFMPVPAEDSGRPESDCALFRIDHRNWRLAVHRAETPGLAYLGWELSDCEAFEDARDHLVSCDITLDTTVAAKDRGVSALVRFVDPYGHAHELFYGAPTNLDRPFVSPAGVTGFETDNGLGHVLFAVPDAHKAEDYYARVLGMKTTDRMDMGGGKRTIFMRSRVRHHMLALTDVLPQHGFGHVMFETRQIRDVGSAWDRVQAAETPIFMSLGQHANDPAVSFYVETPSGNGIEFGWAAMLIDEARWMVREIGPNELWGHRGPQMDEIEAGGGRG
ncbi:MAG: hypothetical protein GY910_07645 [bacterium]|nr:hypothetical protein [Deltaproteobacteria bacterium]MCP4904838.1 hypothetical protein [bacterium]